MKYFLTEISKLATLTNQEITSLNEIVTSKSYRKGEKILKNNSPNNKLYFICNELVKISFFKEEREFVMKFFYEHEFCAVLDSLPTNEPSNYVITALADVNLIEMTL